MFQKISVIISRWKAFRRAFYWNSEDLYTGIATKLYIFCLLAKDGRTDILNMVHNRNSYRTIVLCQNLNSRSYMVWWIKPIEYNWMHKLVWAISACWVIFQDSFVVCILSYLIFFETWERSRKICCLLQLWLALKELSITFFSHVQTIAWLSRVNIN